MLTWLHGADNVNVPSQYSTIQAGINAASDNNTVCVAAGVYNENIVISKPIRLSGSGYGESIINGHFEESQVGYPSTIMLMSTNVTLEGFRINGVGTGIQNLAIWMDNQHSNNILQFNWITSANGASVLQTDGPNRHNDLFLNNIFEGKNSYTIVTVRDGQHEDFLNNTFVGSLHYEPENSETVELSNGAAGSVIQRNVFNTVGEVADILAAQGDSTGRT